MTREEFDARLAALGLSGDEFAALNGQHPATVRGWGKERNVGDGVRKLQSFPGWVPRLLYSWRNHPQDLADMRRGLA